MSEPAELTGPDLAQGIPLAQIPEGELFAAHAFGKPLVLVRRGDFVRAIGGKCTHYGGPLAEGLLVDDTVRCPWHHACFSLDTGEALRAPALNPVPTVAVDLRDGRVVATREIETTDGATPSPDRTAARSAPGAIVIVGGGAAGNAASWKFCAAVPALNVSTRDDCAWPDALAVSAYTPAPRGIA